MGKATLDMSMSLDGFITAGFAYPDRADTGTLPAIRSDSAIEEEIWDRFLKESPSIFHPDNIAVEVDYGQALLTGHLAEEWQRQWARVIAAQVKGVTRVRNEIMPDHILRDRMIRALIEDERTAVYLIRVRCNSGWISVGGMVPTIEAAQAAEEVATRIPVVRGILSLPWVIGLPWTNPYDLEPARRAFQPGIGSVVYDGLTERQPGGAGRVSQIILDPRNRLLSHLVIQVKEPKTGRRLGDKNLSKLQARG